VIRTLNLPRKNIFFCLWLPICFGKRTKESKTDALPIELLSFFLKVSFFLMKKQKGKTSNDIGFVIIL
jgi:hypothetical protein